MRQGVYEDGPCRLKLATCHVVAPHLRSGLLELSQLQTDTDWRGKGYATALLWKTIRACDLNRVALLLKATPFDGEPMDKAALAAWYGRFGFRELAGTPDVMVRMPYWTAPKPAQTEMAQAAALTT